MSRNNHEFQTIRSEGGLLSTSFLGRVRDLEKDIPGITPETYEVFHGERINEKITASWNRLLRHWTEFRRASERLSENETGTSITNNLWTLHLLRELNFGPLPTSAGPRLGEYTYPINRFLGFVPIHLVGCNVKLDQRSAGVPGASRVNPHSLVQEFLNRSADHLWAIVSNGLQLRILRDTQALSRQSFLEFDLESMFNGEIFSDFVLLWLVVHSTRFQAEKPEKCFLEQWGQVAKEQSVRALGDLQGGVKKAMQVLGEGFISFRKNIELQDALRSGKLKPVEFHNELLRVIYRLIFLFTAEDRSLDGQSLLHPPDNSEAGKIARENYSKYYSTTRLRTLAGKIKGTSHTDLWYQFRLLVGALYGDDSAESIRSSLALPKLGSFLWNPNSTRYLSNVELTNYDFLEALRHLAFTRHGMMLHPVDYKNLGAEELGGVYESLLELTPQINAGGGNFSFVEFAGNERKTSGSYYTPDSLVQSLLDSALEPVIEKAKKGKTSEDAEKALLELKICDPAVGSGHFIVAAAHRLTRHLSQLRALGGGEGEASTALYQKALRDVIGSCIYGVDINPMAAELCRVSLWLEALEPGKPLSFLDKHIQVGNSLLGITPDMDITNLPKETFKPVLGDEKRACEILRKLNKAENKGLGPLFTQKGEEVQVRLEESARAIEKLPDERSEHIESKERAFRELRESEEYRWKKHIADAWCSAFFIRKSLKISGLDSTAWGITQNHLEKIACNEPIPDDLTNEIRQLVNQYNFFHWQLAFPEVFMNGGFDCVLGNPPWERIKLQEKEFFESRSPKIANALNKATREQLISQLNNEDSSDVEKELFAEFNDAKRKSESTSLFVRSGGRFPLTGIGDINTYSVFTETFLSLVNSKGHAGIIVPTGIATDDTTKGFFNYIVANRRLASLYDFENREEIFKGVHRSYKFCLLTLNGVENPCEEAEFTFFLDKVEYLGDFERRFRMSADDFALFNPNTRTCPIFRTRRDMEIARKMYCRAGVLWKEARDNEPEVNPWGVRFQAMFHMSNDSNLFKTREVLNEEGWKLEGNIFMRGNDRYLPLYEAKMFHQYDHRFATFDKTDSKAIKRGRARRMTLEEKIDPETFVIPRYWVPEQEVWKRLDQRQNKLNDRQLHHTQAHRQINRYTNNTLYNSPSSRTRKRGGHYVQKWELALRLVTNSTNQRTVIESILPFGGLGNKGAIITLGVGSLLSEQLPTNTNERTIISSLIRRSEMNGKTPLLRITQAEATALFISVLNSFVLDFAAKSAVGGTDLSYFIIKQLPIPQPKEFLDEFNNNITYAEFIIPRVFELAYTTWDSQDFAKDIGYAGPPFAWNENRRFLLKCEIDASLFHLYGINRKDIEYIMDTFSIVMSNDEQLYKEYRTKRVILEIYDDMENSRTTGTIYKTQLKPVPLIPSF